MTASSAQGFRRLFSGLLQSVPHQISENNRHRKWAEFNQAFPTVAEWSVIDVGFGPGGMGKNENYFEKHYLYPNRITALTISEIGDSPSRYPGVNIVKYDGKKIPFADGNFDFLWSNAVVEHVGGGQSQINFLREVDRVADRHFVTTPNRWFPWEVHTRLPLVHYLPKPWFDRIATKAGMGWATGDYMNLMSKKQFEAALLAAGISDYQIITNRFMGIPMDFVAIW
ncbi:MAG: methyltransferase domain-containing protein [Microthrixaceae bacterium]